MTDCGTGITCDSCSRTMPYGDGLRLNGRDICDDCYQDEPVEEGSDDDE